MPTTPANTSKLAKVVGNPTTRKPIKQESHSIITITLITHFAILLISALNNLKTARKRSIRNPNEAIPKVLQIKNSATLAPIGPHQFFTSRFACVNQEK